MVFYSSMVRPLERYGDQSKANPIFGMPKTGRHQCLALCAIADVNPKWRAHTPIGIASAFGIAHRPLCLPAACQCFESVVSIIENHLIDLLPRRDRSRLLACLVSEAGNFNDPPLDPQLAGVDRRYIEQVILRASHVRRLPFVFFPISSGRAA
jgi:hypothetical protein